MADQINDLAEIEGVEVDLTPKPAPGKEGDGARKTAQEGKVEPAKDDENIAALRRQLAAERRDKEAALAQAREIEERRRQAEAQSTEGQLRHIGVSLETAAADKARAKADLASYASTGDWTKHADAQEALNDAQIRIDRLTSGKAEMEGRAAREREAAERQERRVATDPVEAMIAGAKLSGASAAWIRQHPECVTDRSMNRRLIRAHEDAEEEGVAVDTPDYFAFIEKRIGIGAATQATAETAIREDRATPRRPASPAAPVSRGDAGTGRGSRENTVTLSPTQRQFCDDSGIKYEDYARSMVALKKEGRLQ